MDVAVAIADLERLAVVAAAAAHIARDVDIGQEMHFDADQSIALAGFAASAADIEAEAPGIVAAGTRLRDLRIQLADHGEEPRVGSRIRARCATDRILIDIDDALEALEARDGATGSRGAFDQTVVQTTSQNGMDNLKEIDLGGSTTKLEFESH